MTDVTPEVQAVETIGGVISDLVALAERLPVASGQAEPVARSLDSLAAEISEAARMFRATRQPPGLAAAPDGDGRSTSRGRDPLHRLEFAERAAAARRPAHMLGRITCANERTPLLNRYRNSRPLVQ